MDTWQDRQTSSWLRACRRLPGSLSCDPEFHWQKRVGYGNCGVFHFNSSHVALPQHVIDWLIELLVFIVQPGTVRNSGMSLSVSLSATNQLAYLSKITRPNFTDFFVFFYAYWLWAWLSSSGDTYILWLCTSGIVDDVMFPHNGTYNVR